MNSQAIGEMIVQVANMITAIKEAPHIPGRDSGGPELTLAMRDLETAAFRLEQARVRGQAFERHGHGVLTKSE